MFFLLLTLGGVEVSNALLDPEGCQSGLTAVQPALLDDLRHAMEHLERERERGRGKKRGRVKERGGEVERMRPVSNPKLQRFYAY